VAYFLSHAVYPTNCCFTANAQSG